MEGEALGEGGLGKNYNCHNTTIELIYVIDGNRHKNYVEIVLFSPIDKRQIR